MTINQAGGQADPTNSSPIHFTVVFSEPVTGLRPATSRSPAPRADDGVGHRQRTTYNVAVTGMTADGTVIAIDRRGSRRRGRQHQHRLDQHRQHGHLRRPSPTVTINQAAGQADPTNALADPVHRRVQRAGDRLRRQRCHPLRDGGATVVIVTGSGANYTVSVTGMTVAGTVIAIHRRRALRQTPPGPIANTASTSTDNTVISTRRRPPSRLTRRPRSPTRPTRRRSCSRWCSTSR